MSKLLSPKVLRAVPAILLLGGLGLYAQPTHVVRADSGDSLFCLKNPDDPSCPSDEGVTGDTQMQQVSGTYQGNGNNNPQPGYHDNGRGGNTFVNDPCIDPPPPDTSRTVQSETEIAAFGNNMVAGYNDSWGFYDNREGLSGYSYSVDGGNTWVDGGGLPPIIPSGGPATGPGNDGYLGDPVVVVDKTARNFSGQSQAAGEFYYASIYKLPDGTDSLAVNRGSFQTAPPQTTESVADTRCLNQPQLQGVPNTQNLPKTRIVWERPVVAVPVIDPGDFLDKEWLTVNQATGELYLTYTRFGADGSTPLELVRSQDGGRTWEGPFVIVPNLDDTFNTATQATVTSTGRIVVTWYARTFSLVTGQETSDRIEYAYSDDDGTTFSPTQTVAEVNPEGEPPGYNRGRSQILDAPYINTYPHGTDVYITYFSGKPGSPQLPGTVPGDRPSDIYLSSSHDNGTTFGPAVKVNDDDGSTSHVFPTVQVNKNGFVYVSWLDRRNDPSNVLTDTWAAVSKDGGLTFSKNQLQTDVATSWYVRADARPNMGDYNSSELLNDNQFIIIWNDGRFPGGTYIPTSCNPAPAPGQQCPPAGASTPDTMFTIANGLGS